MGVVSSVLMVKTLWVDKVDVEVRGVPLDEVHKMKWFDGIAAGHTHLECQTHGQCMLACVGCGDNALPVDDSGRLVCLGPLPKQAQNTIHPGIDVMGLAAQPHWNGRRRQSPPRKPGSNDGETACPRSCRSVRCHHCQSVGACQYFGEL